MSTDPYEELISIVAASLGVLRASASRIRDSLTTNRRLEKEFEHQVLIALSSVARAQNSGFTFSAIESPHGFPDIIAEHAMGRCFGVEIKTAKTWQTNGNSINSAITDDRIETVIVIFCKTSDPIEFDFKNYEDAITGIQVTHSPRYVLNMRANKDETILTRMGLTYSQFKALPLPEKLSLIKQDYIDKGKADDKWWIY
jgi:hypothetical protein